jgi:putative spermidine/putrescine transport system permease protein
LTAGSYNTLPLEIFGITTNVTTPVIYALGTLTTLFSLLIIAVFLVIVWAMGKRRTAHGSDAGTAV